MKKNKDLIRQFILIIFIGLAVTFFSGEYKWSYTISEPLAGIDAETALSYLNLALPILALAIGLGVVIYLKLLSKEDDHSKRDEE